MPPPTFSTKDGRITVDGSGPGGRALSPPPRPNGGATLPPIFSKGDSHGTPGSRRGSEAVEGRLSSGPRRLLGALPIVVRDALERSARAEWKRKPAAPGVCRAQQARTPRQLLSLCFATLLSFVMSQPRPKQTQICEVESERTFGVGSRAVCADLMGGIDRAGGGTGAGPCGGRGAAAGSASSGLAPYVQCE